MAPPGFARAMRYRCTKRKEKFRGTRRVASRTTVPSALKTRPLPVPRAPLLLGGIYRDVFPRWRENQTAKLGREPPLEDDFISKKLLWSRYNPVRSPHPAVELRRPPTIEHLLFFSFSPTMCREPTRVSAHLVVIDKDRSVQVAERPLPQLLPDHDGGAHVVAPIIPPSLALHFTVLGRGNLTLE